jgi:hypothetical protein
MLPIGEEAHLVPCVGSCVFRLIVLLPAGEFANQLDRTAKPGA